MGLDMYLTARKSFFHKNDEVAKKISELFPELDGMVIRDINIDAVYWRKANAIHQWFVDNVQDGEDDCGEYYVPRSDLKELSEKCGKVLENRELASQLLPVQDGFFFGSPEYDSYYFEQLEKTKEKIDYYLKQIGGWTFYYHASW